ncbi:MAG: Putative signaling protein [Acetothermia bacterium 64_32]|nr:MAG: Putative signaling protein [Acetothermia bacterium 64_32]HAF71187.1 hypothetical protein [Candidatus Acetothermia bacterium]
MGRSVSLDDPHAAVALAARTGQAKVYQHVTQATERRAYCAPALKSALAVPLKAEGDVLGVIVLGDENPERFSEGDLVQAQVLAHLAASALRQARSRAKLQERARELDLLQQAIPRLAEDLELKGVAERLARICVEDIAVRLAWVGRAELDGQVSVIASWPPEHPYPKEISVRWDGVPEGQGPTGRAIREMRLQVTEDMSSDTGYAPWRKAALSYDFTCSAAIPLVSHGHPFGVLNLYSEQPGFFTTHKLNLLQTLANQAATLLENAQLYEKTKRNLAQLETLRNIDLFIISSLDPELTIRVVLDEVTEQLKADAAGVLLAEPQTLTLRLAGARGFRSRSESTRAISITQSLTARKILRDRRVVRLTREKLLEETSFGFRKFCEAEGFVEVYFAPLISKHRPLGMLGIFYRRKPREGVPTDFLEALAAQVAIALENGQLMEELRRSNLDLRAAYDATLEGWARTLELRDLETQNHAQRVTELAVRLGLRMGIRGEALTYLRWGALLHDIGKLGVPDSILLKPGKLDEKEWAEMRKHPEYAYELLSEIEFLRPALDIPYCHHERWDGNGYPRGLKGEEIPLAARIFAVVDAWDAMRSDRPYRKALPVEEAIEEIKKDAGT